MDQFINLITEHYILSTLWAVVFLLLVKDIVTKGFSSIKPLKPQEATIAVNRGGLFVDCRSPENFQQGHINGAKNIPLAKIRAGEVKALEKFKDTPIVAVCDHGNTARSAAAALEKAGFSDVNVLQGGLQAWRNASLPLTKGSPGQEKKKNKGNK